MMTSLLAQIGITPVEGGIATVTIAALGIVYRDMRKCLADRASLARRLGEHESRLKRLEGRLDD